MVHFPVYEKYRDPKKVGEQIKSSLYISWNIWVLLYSQGLCTLGKGSRRGALSSSLDVSIHCAFVQRLVQVAGIQAPMVTLDDTLWGTQL